MTKREQLELTDLAKQLKLSVTCEGLMTLNSQRFVDIICKGNNMRRRAVRRIIKDITRQTQLPETIKYDSLSAIMFDSRLDKMRLRSSILEVLANIAKIAESMQGEDVELSNLFYDLIVNR